MRGHRQYLEFKRVAIRPTKSDTELLARIRLARLRMASEEGFAMFESDRQ